MTRPGLVVASLMVLGLLALAGMGWLLYAKTQVELAHAPGFALTSTGYENHTHGAPVNFTLADYEGQTLVLDFMAVTCATCRIVTDDVLKPLHSEFGDRSDFAILSVDVWAADPFGRAVGENKAGLVRLQEEEGTAWRHALDTDDLLQKYGAVGIPLVTVIDGEGRIVYQSKQFPQHDEIESAVRSSLSGNAETASIVQAGILGLSFLAGMAVVLSPCSVGLLPVYVGQLVAPQANGRRGPGFLLGLGAKAAAGVVALYAALAVALWVSGPALRRNLEWGGFVVAASLILVGTASAAGASWSRLLPASVYRARPRGMFGFGLAYGAAAFGCTGPIFIPLLAAAFLEGPLLGVTSFAAYALGVGLLLVTVAYLVATGFAAGLTRFLPRAAVINRVAAILMVASGAYLIWFYARAGVLPWQG